MILVDTNVLIDLSQPESRWHDWSATAVALAPVGRHLVCNVVIVAEFAAGFAEPQSALVFLSSIDVAIAGMRDGAALRAAAAFADYRRAGGVRHAILADFLIGGHAADLGATLLTRDRQRFASYFPDLPLITPETHPHG